MNKTFEFEVVVTVRFVDFVSDQVSEHSNFETQRAAVQRCNDPCHSSANIRCRRHSLAQGYVEVKHMLVHRSAPVQALVLRIHQGQLT